MAKVIKEEDFNEIIYKEKIKLYEIENSEIQYILKQYWKRNKKKRPEFPNIREEINYIVNQSQNPIKRKLKSGFQRLRGK